jgi:predicted Zn-ribbon and HTH transcriptional regulator
VLYSDGSVFYKRKIYKVSHVLNIEESKMEQSNKSESAARRARMVPMVCLECGRHFKKYVSKHAVEAKCPGCGGVDTEVD